MAHISITHIEDIQLTILPFERTHESETLHQRVREMYKQKGYELKPRSAAEADARGERSFNGLVSSFPRITTYNTGRGMFVTADIAPTRYLIGQAMRDVVASEQPATETIRALSPDMANVSLIAPVKHQGDYFLLAQIKGKALGSGQVHTGIVAGNVDDKYLTYPDPLLATLQNECSEELGIDLSYLKSTSFTFMIDERETGQVNFASVAQGVDLTTILDAYEATTKRKLARGEALEVMALTRLPIAGIALVPLEGTPTLTNIDCYVPTAEGLKAVPESRGVRPYTEATVAYLQSKQNVHTLLEKAGF
jgi:hypothetical protein